jgi:hypothetical protein
MTKNINMIYSRAGFFNTVQDLKTEIETFKKKNPIITFTPADEFEIKRGYAYFDDLKAIDSQNISIDRYRASLATKGVVDLIFYDSSNTTSSSD